MWELEEAPVPIDLGTCFERDAAIAWAEKLSVDMTDADFVRKYKYASQYYRDYGEIPEDSRDIEDAVFAIMKLEGARINNLVECSPATLLPGLAIIRTEVSVSFVLASTVYDVLEYVAEKRAISEVQSSAA
jgi:hypothetical protein